MSVRVLVVDDARFMREMVKHMLRGTEFEVVAEAGDGREAVEVYAQSKPDLVLMDIIMPDFSGIDAVRALRAQDPTARIVMCSAVDQESAVMESLDAGAADFVVKPFLPRDALAVLRRVVSQPR